MAESAVAKELYLVDEPSEVFDHCQPLLKSKVNISLGIRAIFPSEFDEGRMFDHPTIALSRQSVSKIAEARSRGFFAGRIGFSGDGVNEFIVNNDTACVLVTPFLNLSAIGPVIPRAEIGKAGEKEWALCTGVPLEAIEVILPASLFRQRLPDFVVENPKYQALNEMQRASFEEKYRKAVILPQPDEYALSLAYNWEQTGQILTEKQRNMLSNQDYNHDKFWQAAAAPLRRFTLGDLKDHF
jgi:hypothetical protein